MKSEELVIAEFDKGISMSPHFGFADMRNLDIHTIPGIVRLNNKLSKASASLVAAKINWIVRDPISAGSVVAISTSGVVYGSNDAGASWYELADRDGNGQGMIIWKNYLFVAETTTIDVYGPLSGGAAAWSNNWQTIDSDASFHPMFISVNDGKLYGGAGRYVFSVEELTTFAPGTAASYSYTQQALDLPADYRIKCLTELGENLMLGTWMGASVFQFSVADIFPWDRSSPSFTTPLRLNVNGCHAMVNINNILYILAGIEGKIYSSNGVQSALIGHIPISLANIEGGKFLVYHPGAIANYKGRLFFGVSDGDGNTAGMGVWSLLPTERGNILNLEHEISTGTPSSTTLIEIGAIYPVSRDILLVGWRDQSTYGIDRSDNDDRQASYSGYFDSAFYMVGTYGVKKQFQEIEFQLAKPLTSLQGVALSFRTNLTDPFTIIGTFTHSTASTTQVGAVASHVTTPGIPSSEFVQIRAALAPGASNSNSSPELRAVILR